MAEKDTISPQLAAEILAQLGHVRGMQEQEGDSLQRSRSLEAQDASEERRRRDFDGLVKKVGSHHEWIERAKG